MDEEKENVNQVFKMRRFVSRVSSTIVTPFHFLLFSFFFCDFRGGENNLTAAVDVKKTLIFAVVLEPSW